MSITNMGMEINMATDYEQWRLQHGLRPVNGTKVTRTLNLSDKTWLELTQLALDHGLKFRGKPSVGFLMELIANGTLKLVEQGQQNTP
jgi:hypothetical protein